MSATDLAAPVYARRSIVLWVEVTDGLIVQARQDELAQVIANLLQNPGRYTPSNGTV